MQQAFGFLGRVGFIACLVLKPFVTGANWQNPIAAHLDAFVQRLQRLIVKGVFASLGFACPDHRLMRIGKAFATEIRHRVRLAPDHIIEDPIALVLKSGTNAEYVVVATDHPDRAIHV